MATSVAVIRFVIAALVAADQESRQNPRSSDAPASMSHCHSGQSST